MSFSWLPIALALLLSPQSPPDDSKKKDDPPKQGSGHQDKDTDKAGKKGDDDEIIIIKQKERRKTGRLGELTEDEEAKRDKIVNDFIQHDIGSMPNPNSVKQLDSLGADAIPAIVRGVNKSAGYSHSCPVTVLCSKLISLIKRSDDPAVLSFIRNEVGAGMKTTKYLGLINRVKAETTLRQSELSKAAKAAEKSRPPSLGDGGGRDSGKDGKDSGKERDKDKDPGKDR